MIIKPLQQWLSIKEAAEYTGMSGNWIRGKIYTGELPASNMSNKNKPYWRIDKAVLQQFVEEMR